MERTGDLCCVCLSVVRLYITNVATYIAKLKDECWAAHENRVLERFANDARMSSENGMMKANCWCKQMQPSITYHLDVDAMQVLESGVKSEFAFSIAAPERTTSVQAWIAWLQERRSTGLWAKEGVKHAIANKIIFHAMHNYSAIITTNISTWNTEKGSSQWWFPRTYPFV